MGSNVMMELAYLVIKNAIIYTIAMMEKMRIPVMTQVNSLHYNTNNTRLSPFNPNSTSIFLHA